MGRDDRPVALRYPRRESVCLALPERQVEELVSRTVPTFWTLEPELRSPLLNSKRLR